MEGEGSRGGKIGQREWMRDREREEDTLLQLQGEKSKMAARRKEKNPKVAFWWQVSLIGFCGFVDKCHLQVTEVWWLASTSPSSDFTAAHHFAIVTSLATINLSPSWKIKTRCKYYRWMFLKWTLKKNKKLCFLGSHEIKVALYLGGFYLWPWIVSVKTISLIAEPEPTPHAPNADTWHGRC